MTAKNLCKCECGFTLIELMITLAIVAILATVALPSYLNHVTEMRRTAAQSCLMELVHFTERYYSDKMTYAGATLPTLECRTKLTAHYTFAYATDPTTTAYTITATAEGGQATKDSACTPLQITQSGARSPSTGCWK